MTDKKDCPFCKHGWPLHLQNWHIYLINTTVYKHRELIIENPYGSTAVKIFYCPMCGKKLEDPWADALK